jgi:hypothetical protein
MKCAFYADEQAGTWSLWDAKEVDEEGTWVWHRNQRGKVEFFDMEDPSSREELLTHTYKGKQIGEVIKKCEESNNKFNKTLTDITCKIIGFESSESSMPDSLKSGMASNNIRLDGINRQNISEDKYKETLKVIASPAIKSFLDSRAGKDLIEVASELRTKFNLTDYETFMAITHWEVSNE